MNLKIIFWFSIGLAIFSSLKAKKYNSSSGNDLIFLFSAWPLFNLGLWTEYLNSFNQAALILIALSLIYAKKRELNLGLTVFSKSNFLCAAKWLAIAAFCLIAAGFYLKFLYWNPRMNPDFLLKTATDYYLFTATTEELIFRGIIFNLLSKKWKYGPALIITNILFSLTFSHIAGGGIFPNWKYVLMAFSAGILYTHSYKKSGNIVVPVFLHGTTDTLWRTLFTATS